MILMIHEIFPSKIGACQFVKKLPWMHVRNKMAFLKLYLNSYRRVMALFC